ncbi:hypothetical protein EVAR_89121_1 [Eumeta japonica]|uniref:Band 4.1-like protein 4A n=1 Tax=Eumeta variegata TaxID=151549 RepID=A0A4C1ZRN7_EUMVA|nr:hypothetical protein EVAR_89121_1 [Eumeta japonica]
MGLPSGSGRGSRPRPPPAFTRTPSRRAGRALHSSHASLHDVSKLENLRIKDCPEVKQPTSVQRPNSVSGEMLGCESGPGGAGGSPRSTRSAPARRGLYSASPTATRPPPAPRHRSSSVDSQSSNESRSNRKSESESKTDLGLNSKEGTISGSDVKGDIHMHIYHPMKRDALVGCSCCPLQSDAESELSRGSGRSARRNRRQRSRHKHESGSERDEGHHETKEYELVDSESQWKEVLRQTNAGSGVQIASVRRSHNEPEVGTHRSHRHRRHRKHRSRSGSPNDKKWLPNELKQHLEFSLVDTEGMTEEQLKEIPYTVVQTSHARQAKLRSSSRHKQTENGSLARREKNSSTHSKNNHDAHSQGSLRSVSSNVSIHRNGGEKHGGRRIYPTYEDPSTKAVDFLTNTTYKSNSTALTSVSSNPYSPVTNSNSNSSSGELISGTTRVSHEHTDSGLGADQDYAYSSERSSDSTKCGAGSASGAAAAPVSTAWATGNGSLAVLARRPPAGPGRARPAVSGTGVVGTVSGSQRSLVSVASEGRATSRHHRHARPPAPHYPHPLVDSGFSLFVSGASLFNILPHHCFISKA